MSDPVVVTNVSRGIALVGGPQDGACVTMGNGRLPSVLFVGPRWLGDGFAAWGRKRSERFPVCYRFNGRVFVVNGGEFDE